MRKIAIFASGAGSNALNLIEKSFDCSNLTISCVVVDTESSPLPHTLCERYPDLSVYKIIPDLKLKNLERKDEFETRILEKLKSHGVEWILLAGYMRIIGPTLLKNFPEKIINIHPSLLPAYPGLHGFERAYADKVSSGVTIHLVDAGLDTGPILLQEKFPFEEGESFESYVQKGKRIEWELYPKVLKRLNDGAY